MTALVDVGDLPIPFKGPEFPHITIAVNSEAGGRPEMSNDFLPDDFEEIPGGPIILNGTVQEVFRDVTSEAKASRKSKVTLYHIGRRPAAPKPKTRWSGSGQPSGSWKRPWLEKDVESGVFLSPSPANIAVHHGIRGNVYAYKIPRWVIDKAGGINRYDHGSEILIPDELWHEAGDEIEFLGKSMSSSSLEKKAREVYDSLPQINPFEKPGWYTEEEWEKKKRFSKYAAYTRGLRKTKYLDNAIKSMSQDERREALDAFIDANKSINTMFIDVRDKDIMDALKTSLDD